jgi:TonB family protein
MMLFLIVFFILCPVDLRTKDESFDGAVPKNAAIWVTSADYPEGVIERNESGKVTVSFEVNKVGRVTNCRVSQSSGYAILDEIPCKLLERRARFIAALDKYGKPRFSRAHTSFYFSPEIAK